jgi:hypothetical protein
MSHFVAKLPGMGGRYVVRRRWVITAADATSGGIPNAVSPVIMAASVTPIPPGTGTRLARNAELVFTKTSCPNDKLEPYAIKHAPRQSEYRS